MKYRINRKTGDRISEIGIGSSYMFGAGMAEAIPALRCAVEGGINYFDLAAGDGKTFPIYGEALTQYQCIRYCLDKPGILTVLPGAQSVQEVFYRRGNIIHHNILIHSARDYTR